MFSNFCWEAQPFTNAYKTMDMKRSKPISPPPYPPMHMCIHFVSCPLLKYFFCRRTYPCPVSITACSLLGDDGHLICVGVFVRQIQTEYVYVYFCLCKSHRKECRTFSHCYCNFSLWLKVEVNPSYPTKILKILPLFHLCGCFILIFPKIIIIIFY